MPETQTLGPVSIKRVGLASGLDTIGPVVYGDDNDVFIRRERAPIVDFDP
jgi:hypothetical protein